MTDHPAPTHLMRTAPVKIRATFEAVSWTQQCPGCGSENFTRRDVHCLNKCDACHLAFDTPNPSADPKERSGFCDPSNPWGTVSYADTEPTELELNVADAVEFLADFPGAVWGHSQVDSTQDQRTGEYVSVTAHVDGPGAALALRILELSN